MAATYLKQTLSVSFDSGSVWGTCHVAVQINRYTNAGIKSVAAKIDHASRRQHLVDCHLPRLSVLYDWDTYRPQFDSTAQTQHLLPLLALYSIALDTPWAAYYDHLKHCSVGERIAQITTMAARIASTHRWQPAVRSLKTRNPERTIYTIPDSHFIMSVDTEQGEFEAHRSHQGNNHLGAITFDGKRFKPPIANRKLNL